MGFGIIDRALADLDELRGSTHAEDFAADSIRTGELSNWHVLDPDVSDWGAAVESKLSGMSDGDALLVPPGRYKQFTPVEVDKSVLIAGWGDVFPNEGVPRVRRQSDFVQLELNDLCAVRGLRFNGFDADTRQEPGIVAHNTPSIHNVAGTYIGTTVFLEQASSGDNLNQSKVTGVRAEVTNGDAVRVENTSGEANDVNAIEVEVRSAFEIDGWGINAVDGLGGSNFRVRHAEGAALNGGIRLGGSNCMARLDYAEGNISKAIQFDGDLNRGVIGLVTVSQDNEFIFNGVNNLGRRLLPRGTPRWVSTGRTHSFAGEDLETTTAGQGLVVTTPDGSARYRIRVDNTGAVTSEQL
jgi:hypothetical protein